MNAVYPFVSRVHPKTVERVPISTNVLAGVTRTSSTPGLL
jgi:hypothetical protein